MIVSSASRGIDTHEKISRFVKNNFNTQESFEEKHLWALKKLKKLNEKYILLSEESIEFDFFNHIITGIADIVCRSREDSATFKVIDFKTGSQNSDKEKIYKFQLKCYAQAFSQRFKSRDDQEIETEIWYLDEEKVVSTKQVLSDTKDDLYKYWERTAFSYQQNLSHCDSCEFGKLCHK